MSSSPECRKCGDYIHHGPVLCDQCDDAKEVATEKSRICRALGRYASHAPFDVMSAKQIQADLFSICGEKHTHVASIGSDECNLCGRDIRHAVHSAPEVTL